MPPKKKLKNSEDRDFKEENVAGPSNEEHLDTNIKNPPTRLSFLPVDVLLYIYKFLSSGDISSLSQLGDPKFSELADVQRKVNFSVCRRTSFELMSSYFSKERVKYIQKLNFSFYIFAKPSDLVQIICRCKNLIVLSVIECGIQYKQILKILENCSMLKELSWNIKENGFEEKNSCHSSVKKLFLFCNTSNNPGVFKLKIPKTFPRVENAVICSSQEALIVPPFITLWSQSLSLLFDQLQMITMIKNDLIDGNSGVVMDIKLDKTHTMLSDACYNQPPFLKVEICERNIKMLASCTSNSYSSVIIHFPIIHFATNILLNTYERFFESISKVVGSKVKYLSVECERKNSSKPSNMPVLPTEFHQNIPIMLETVILKCENITVLNFGEIHFTSGSPLKAICNLKNLEVFLIPTCAIPKTCSDFAGSSSQQNQDQESVFEEMVSKCWKVTDFQLICCNSDMDLMEGSEICPIQNWKCLTSFSIYNVIFKTCPFIRKIADFCSELQSFSLIGKAPRSGYILYNDVIYLLRHAKKLSFIRINEESFNPTFEPFMNAIGFAKNLEGICFMTKLETVFNASSFIKNLEVLKYFHLFHFQAPRVSDRLFAEIRKLMNRNGIKNIKVEKDCGYCFRRSGNELELQENYLFSHPKPSFYCEHLHLNKFIFDFSSFFL